MSNFENHHIINQPWPEEDLEYLDSCPLCGSNNRTIAYKDVQDWTFCCAPGKWTYWDCNDCQALYLNPRPNKKSIGKAYGSYYTHAKIDNISVLQKLKQRLINECWSHWFQANIAPRIGFPFVFAWFLGVFKTRWPAPFEIEALAKLPKGRLMDVGCGSGNTLKLASILGWNVTGLEIDPVALSAARSKGLDVVAGTYQKLVNYKDIFDYIICSHVIEHVHDPIELLKLISGALKQNGVALISSPNSNSYIRHQFGENWRGLEAPRHLGIPSLEFMFREMGVLGFKVVQINPIGATTLKQSLKIKANRKHLDNTGLGLDRLPKVSEMKSSPDLIQIVCKKI